jgi:hypothetical protein
MKRIHNAPWGVFFIKVPLWVYYSYWLTFHFFGS